MTDQGQDTAALPAHLGARLEEAVNHLSLGIVIFDEKREVAAGRDLNPDQQCSFRFGTALSASSPPPKQSSCVARFGVRAFRCNRGRGCANSNDLPILRRLTIFSFITGQKPVILTRN